MKKCPFCAEEIQDDAIKCKHCNEWLNKTNTSTVSTSDEDDKNEVNKVYQSHINKKEAKQKWTFFSELLDPNMAREQPLSKLKGFSWGRIWIALGFLQGGIAFIFGFILGITTEYIPDRVTGLIIGILGIGSALFLMKRKKIGLYLVYLICLVGIIIGLVDIINFNSNTQATNFVKGLLSVFFSSMWFVYFWRRRTNGSIKLCVMV